jgi:hypothetical protein
MSDTGVENLLKCEDYVHFDKVTRVKIDDTRIIRIQKGTVRFEDDVLKNPGGQEVKGMVYIKEGSVVRLEKL